MQFVKPVFLILVLLVVFGTKPVGADTGVGDSALFSLSTLALSGVADGGRLPLVHSMAPCYPNPFNPSTTIRFYLATPGKVELTVYDLKGRLVRSLITGQEIEAGTHEIAWRGRTDFGRTAAGGVYLCRLKVDGLAYHQRMTLIK